MHVEIRVPEKYDVEEVFKRLHREFLKAEVSLKEITFESVRSESRIMDGRVMIYAVIFSNSQEKLAGGYDAAEKTLKKMGFEVKSRRPLD
jgi:hypothetical protein